MKTNRLAIFTRYPEPGTTKTRLIPALGAEGAARLQCDLTRHALAQAREFRRTAAVTVEVRYDGGDAERMAECFGNDMAYRPQGAGDLGCRMERAFAEAFHDGAARVVVVGADCPGITPRVLRDAFERLATADVVLGPATDGGYYLVGLRRPVRELFHGIAWGGEQVLQSTLDRAAELSQVVSLLEPLSDVDRPEDLHVWRRVLTEGDSPIFTVKGNSPRPMPSPPRKSGPSSVSRCTKISVIIPTWDEALYLPQALANLLNAPGVEVIVADGGSTDATLEVAVEAGCRVLRCAPGRAGQMNAGAKAAGGDILLFLHADSWLPERFAGAVREALTHPGVAAGAFRLRIDGPEHALRLIEWGVRLRSRVLQMPYGDQALFMKAETFHAVGGFPDVPIMDDFVLVRRLRRLGRIVILPQPVTTSARRWHALGPWRTMWINQKVIAGYHLGVPPDRLARWYRADVGR